MLKRPILFLATARPEDATTFYESTLGFTLISDTPFALVFDVAGTELRIQKVESVVDVPYTALGWAVDNIEASVAELSEKGVRCEFYDHFDQDELGIWTSPGGARIAWFRDPDNNTLSLTQY